MKNNIFDNLLILDLANNHFGDMLHSKNIIKKFSKIVRNHKAKATIKFQFRQLPEFIHEDFRDSNLKYVRRFLDTKLSDSDFFNLFKLESL